MKRTLIVLVTFALTLAATHAQLAPTGPNSRSFLLTNAPFAAARATGDVTGRLASPMLDRNTLRSNLARAKVMPSGGGEATNHGALMRGSVMSQTVAERGPHHRVWATTLAVTNRSGAVSYRTNRYTELATGLHYREDGQWKETQPVIEPFPGGAVARRGPHKVLFGANLNTAGAIDLETPDGVRLRSHVLALGYFDASSGQRVFLAEVKDCVGGLVGSNQVVYADAFRGVKADVRYTYRRSGFEQDIILREQPPSPEQWGLKTGSTHLEVWTEFVNPPEPQKLRETTRAGSGLADQDLKFGTLRLVPGKAFAENPDTPARRKVAVGKRWVNILDRTLLVETVRVSDLHSELEALPRATTVARPPVPERAGAVAADFASPPPRRSPATGTASLQLAQAGTPSAAGVVLDYEEINDSFTDFTFQGDTTYYVSDSVDLFGTTTLEGGTVIKYAPVGNSQALPRITVYDEFQCLAEAYRPCIFTARDDDTVGELLAESDGDPGGRVFGCPALYLVNYGTGDARLEHVRFSHLRYALEIDNYPRQNTLNGVQLVDCDWGFGFIYSHAKLYNVLAGGVNQAFASAGLPVAVQHLTAHTVASVFGSECFGEPGDPVLWNVKNSVFADITSLTWSWLGNNINHLSGDHNGFYNCTQFGTAPVTGSASPFETSGGGAHYLKADSTFRNAGTTAVDSALLDSLKTKTTQPPIAFPRFMELTGELTLFPQIPRYVSGPPDLGYHYAALDYTAAAMFVDGGTVTIKPGTAIGFRQEFVPEEWWPWWWTEVGIDVLKSSGFTSHGTPTRPNVFADVQMVQEVSDCPVFSLFITDRPLHNPSQPAFPPDDPQKPPPNLDFRFSQFFISSERCHFFNGWDFASPFQYWYFGWSSAVDLTLQDCSVFGGHFLIGKEATGINPACHLSWINNLFDRVKAGLDPDWFDLGDSTLYVDLGVEVRNNLFRGGGVRMVPIPATVGNWVFKDNMFDDHEFLQDDTQPVNHDHNAYWPRVIFQWGGTPRLGPEDGANDVTLAQPPLYGSGPFGNFYQSIASLADAGSRTAAEAGLFHYTTRVDQTKEGSETGNVNIGLHYVATASSVSTAPKDTDGDGIPDYVENWHGDGDTGSSRIHTENETDWNNATTDTDPVTSLPIADPVNTKYDDIDLSGSGLVGRIKKALNLQPFDTSNPLSLTQITTGHEPDIASFKVGRQVGGPFVPLDYDLLASIGVLTLNLDGFDATLQNSARATIGNGALLRWNTTYEPPGQHFLQARLTLNGTGANAAILSGVGALVPLYSANVCRFFESDALFDANGAYLDAQLPVPNATYSIRIYDPSTTPPTLLKTIPTTSTSSGMIQEDWDLVCDSSSSPFAGTAFDAAFDITLLAEDGITPIATGTPTKRHSKLATTEQGNGFNVAYMLTASDSRLAAEFSSSYGNVWIGMQGVVDTLTQPYWPWPWGWYDSSFDRYTGWAPQSPYPGYVGSMATVVPLLNSLSDGQTKNFYCYAHGSPDTLANDAEDVKLTARLVAEALVNTGIPEFPYVTKVNNPYRFVFLDACNTIVDHQWRHAFGISRMGPDNQAARPILGPQAFVGWKGMPVDWFAGYYNDGKFPDPGYLDVYKSKAVQSAYAATLQSFFSDWMNGQPLRSCIWRASNLNIVQCPLQTPRLDAIAIHAPFASPSFNYDIPEKFRNCAIKLYGHPGLTRYGLDSSADNPTALEGAGNRD